MFGFDDQTAMFDVTPVENQFILEYMPTARGDFVKVYLYGLMHCYFPRADLSITEMAHDLAMTEDEILTAYRHWERLGLVRRVSDKPPVFSYVNIKRNAMMGGTAAVDPAYESFAEAVYAMFGSDRRIHGKEMALCYEWVEDLGLPAEVVILLLQHMINMRGKGFSIPSAQKLAMQLADENARTIEDAEQVLARDRLAWDGSRAVLRRMGKRRAPTEDEMALYTKWNREWGFAPDAIEAACARMTRGDPSFAYLDGILRGLREKNGAASSGQELEQTMAQEAAQIAPLKKLLSALGAHDLTVNDGTLRVYRDMKALCPDDGIILMAAKECAQRGGRLDDVMALLDAWKRRGLTTEAQVQEHIDRVKRQDALLRRLYELWGSRSRPNAGDRRLLESWQQELGLEEAFIVSCAGYASSADKPMPYLDKVLRSLAAAGIRTPEAAAEARAQHQAAQPAPAQGGKTVREQQYEQREYEAGTGLPGWMAEMLKKMEAEGNDA